MAAGKKPKPTTSSAHPFSGLSALRDSLPDATKPIAEHAALEAAIAKAPESPDLYLVYGDALQAAGDPRGTLIALSHASLLAPKSVAKRDQVQAFIDEHRSYLLGSLATTNEVICDWYLGFIRSATIDAISLSRALDLLDLLAAVPSARFLRELVIASPGKATRRTMSTQDGKKIVERLVALGKPATLEQLRIPIDGGFVGTPELYETFPKLARDPSTALSNALAKAKKKAGRFVVHVDEAELPPLVAQEGVVPPEPLDVGFVLQALKAELDGGHTFGLVDAMTSAFTRASLDAFALAVVRRGDEVSQRDPWAFDLLGPFSDDGCVSWLHRILGRVAHDVAVHGIRVLERNGTDLAVCAIYTLFAAPSNLHPRRAAAQQALVRMAEEQGLTRHQLVDRACLRRVSLSDWDRVPAVDDARRAWLSRLMVSGRRWPIEEFRREVLACARDVSFLRGLVFVHVVHSPGSPHATLTPFRIDEERARDVNGAPLDLGDRGSVGVAHPVELGPAVAAWRESLARAKVDVPFDPFARAAPAGLEPNELALSVIERFAERTPGVVTAIRRLEARDWTLEGYGTNLGRPTTASKTFVRSRATITARLTDKGGLARVSIAAADNAKNAPRTFGDLHPVVLHELLCDLEETCSDEA